MADEHRETHELIIENHELRRHGDDAEIAGLRAELAGLRAEVAAHAESDLHHGHAAEEFEIEEDGEDE